MKKKYIYWNVLQKRNAKHKSRTVQDRKRNKEYVNGIFMITH